MLHARKTAFAEVSFRVGGLFVFVPGVASLPPSLKLRRTSRFATRGYLLSSLRDEEFWGLIHFGAFQPKSRTLLLVFSMLFGRQQLVHHGLPIMGPLNIQK